MIARGQPSIRALYTAIGRSGGLTKLAPLRRDTRLAPVAERGPRSERETPLVPSALETEPAPPPESGTGAARKNATCGE